MFRFAHSLYLYFLILIPVFLVLILISHWLKKRSIRKYGDMQLLRQLMPEISFSRPLLKSFLMLAALTSVIFMLARPQFGSKLREIKREGVEVVIALDVSNSMLAEDIRPNRLERAKQSVSGLVDRLVNDKIGLIVFAGDAYVQVPITTDYVSAKLFLSSIGPDIVPVQGTAIGKAIELGMKSFSPEAESSKALIVITDGENHEGNALESAGKASERGVTVHTIGIGLPRGAPIPVVQGGQKTYRKDREGNVIISKMNQEMLREIADAGDGIFLRANNTNQALNTLFDEINSMEKQEMEARIYSEYKERFQYLAGFAAFLLIFDLLLLERKNRWLSRINLFDSKKAI